MITSAAFADSVEPFYDGTLFTGLLSSMGLGPTIGIEVIFLLVLFGLAICFSRKSLNVKEKPENKKTFTFVAIAITIITILCGALLIYDTVEENYYITNGAFYNRTF
jgi:hypothetical protein